MHNGRGICYFRYPSGPEVMRGLICQHFVTRNNGVISRCQHACKHVMIQGMDDCNMHEHHACIMVEMECVADNRTGELKHGNCSIMDPLDGTHLRHSNSVLS